MSEHVRYFPIAWVFLLLLACSDSGSRRSFDVNRPNDTNKNQSRVQQLVRNMSMEKKVGQLFIIHMYGQTPTDPDFERTNLNNDRGAKHFKEAIRKYHVGGFIYFNWNHNIGSPVDLNQVQDLSNDLQRIAMESDPSVPLFLAVDQEGGDVQRVRRPATVFPGNMALGATRSTDRARAAARVMGRELRSLGINFNFAPVADVNVNPENPVIGVRSFGEEPELVANMVAAQVQGFQEQDVLATAKHFPGHGDTDVDSHKGLPKVTHDRETLDRVDLKPFRAAMENGVDAIMTAHLLVPALDDSGTPATLSKDILTGVLRKELGFDGLIVTDSLGMAGARVDEPGSVSVRAFKAGADLLLNPPNVKKAYQSVLQAVRSGKVSEERLNASVRRILYTKANYGLFQDPYASSTALDAIGASEHRAEAKRIARESITLVRDRNDNIPLEPGTNVLVTGPKNARPETLAGALAERNVNTDVFPLDKKPGADQRQTGVKKARNADHVVVLTYDANINAGQARYVQSLREKNIPVTAVAVHQPYDLSAYPEVDTYLATYSTQPVSLRALADVLVGEIEAEGSLPVTIPNR